MRILLLALMVLVSSPAFSDVGFTKSEILQKKKELLIAQKETAQIRYELQQDTADKELARINAELGISVVVEPEEVAEVVDVVVDEDIYNNS